MEKAENGELSLFKKQEPEDSNLVKLYPNSYFFNS